jgi:hypothetical protein
LWLGLEPGRKRNLPLGLLLCYHSAMSKSSYDNITKPVRKRSAVTGTLVGVRLQADQIKAIDAWASKQSPPVTRPEAIRGIIELGLKAKKS